MTEHSESIARQSMEDSVSKCVRCDKHEKLVSIESTMDLRTIIMRCGYNMEEFDLPLTKVGGGQWALRVCKPCRSDWLIAQELWFNQPTDYHHYSIIKHIADIRRGK